MQRHHCDKLCILKGAKNLCAGMIEHRIKGPRILCRGAKSQFIVKHEGRR